MAHSMGNVVMAEGSESAELESWSAHLALHADALKSAAFGATVHAGQAVYVEGISPSPAVNADRIVWRWTDENNWVHRVTNAFTVLSVRLFGDVNLDGDYRKTPSHTAFYSLFGKLTRTHSPQSPWAGYARTRAASRASSPWTASSCATAREWRYVC